MIERRSFKNEIWVFFNKKALNHLRCRSSTQERTRGVKKFHIALSTKHISDSICDYSQRLGVEPCVVVANEYALWRTNTINLSIRQDSSCRPGELRHLGWEDSAASNFNTETDVNDITWEYFNAKLQADEINRLWPQTAYQAES